MSGTSEAKPMKPMHTPGPIPAGYEIKKSAVGRGRLAVWERGMIIGWANTKWDAIMIARKASRAAIFRAQAR